MPGIRFARSGRMFGAAALLSSFLSIFLPGAPVPGSSSHASFPRLVLWAWERPEDLRFLAGRDAGVAFLASTVRLSGEAAQVLRRRQPLRVDPSTPLLAVVRVESVRGARPLLTQNQRDAVIGAALAASRLPAVRGVQIDGDAERSERAFFRGVLEGLRRNLPREKTLSFTALASWCLGDRWMEGLPVDETVPMFFEMGIDAAAARASAAPARLDPVCRGAIGLSTDDEMVTAAAARRRIYLFSRRPWTQEALDDALRRVAR